MEQILLIEDETRIAELIKRGLEDEGFRVTLAYDGDLGIKIALQKKFDLIITDVILPKTNGLDVCKELKKQLPETPVLMLTALGTTDDKLEGFDAGADDYLVKPFEMRELAARVKVLIKRYIQTRTNPGSEILLYADLELDTRLFTVKRHHTLISLTPKEFKLLEYFMKNPERVLSRNEIAEKVWDTHFDTGTNFIDVYINYLRKKIDKPFNPKLIHTKQGIGFILTTKNSP